MVATMWCEVEHLVMLECPIFPHDLTWLLANYKPLFPNAVRRCIKASVQLQVLRNLRIPNNLAFTLSVGRRWIDVSYLDKQLEKCTPAKETVSMAILPGLHK